MFPAWLRARLQGAGRIPNPLFDAEWYLWRYPDLRDGAVDVSRHYWTHGAAEGRDPNPLFATRWYRERNPAARGGSINPLDHYYLFGAQQGLDPSPAFNTELYLSENDDVRAAGINPLHHFLRYGMHEGRRAAPSSAAESSAAARDPLDDLPPRIAEGQRPAFAACTIIARNYLSQARVVADSFVRHHPGARFYLLVADGLPDGIQPGGDITLIGPEDLGLDHFRVMAMRYDVTELSTALKPTLLSLLLGRYGEEAVAYLDPDIVVARPLDELAEAIAQHDIVLTPHLLQPIPLDGHRPSEQDILIAGAFNLGFIAVRRSDAASAFLRWWEERLREHCLKEPEVGLMVDQKWIDLAPGMFPIATLRDETYNVAYWNLNSRRLEYERGTFLVNGRPLAFFHYSGFNPAEPNRLSKHQDRITVTPGSPLERLLGVCALLNLRAGNAEFSEWEYGYARFSNGVPIHPVAAQIYREMPEEERSRFGDPFDAEGPSSFFNWLTTTPAAQPRGVVQSPPAPSVASNGNAPALGVNVVGYLRDESGVGAVARAYVRVLRSLGVPVALYDVSNRSPNRSQDDSIELTSDGGPYDVNLVAVNADQFVGVAADLGREFFADRHSIGVWQWELPSFPPEWRDRFADYDELWVGTSFIVNALAPLSPIPIVRVPPPLEISTAGDRSRGRARLGIAEDETLFAFIFDFHSYFQRKNPLAAVAAFTAAFTGSERVRMVIKCANETFDRHRFLALQMAAAADPRVTVHTGYWSPGDVADLMSATDAYVSLHRSEGIGLTMADAMARAKPVIATGWSGNMDFMTVANSFPVAFDLVALDEDVGPYRGGQTWADPAVDDAARLMRLVFDDPLEAGRRGQRAAADIARWFSADSVGRVVEERLQVILRQRASATLPSATEEAEGNGASGRGAVRVGHHHG